MVCLPFEDDIHKKYAGVDLSLSGWGFTTVRNEEKSKGTKYSFIILLGEFNHIYLQSI